MSSMQTPAEQRGRNLSISAVQTEFDVTLSKSIVTRIIKKFGFIWEKGTLSSKITIDPEKLERVRRFFF